VTSERLRAQGVACVLLDIEGTTTPLAFVREVLFPYARHRLRSFLDAQGDAPPPAVRDAIAALTDEYATDVASRVTLPVWTRDAADRAGLAAYLGWLMDRDRKSPGLKTLQGLIWEEGYQRRDLRGQVFPDVPAALRRWHAAQIGVAIFSSGSVLAQRLLFGHSDQGDLAPLLSGYFDTTTGPKREATSYARIADALGTPAAEALFVSDVVAELDAARAAGFATALSVRAEPGPAASGHPRITTFDALP